SYPTARAAMPALYPSWAMSRLAWSILYTGHARVLQQLASASRLRTIEYQHPRPERPRTPFPGRRRPKSTNWKEGREMTAERREAPSLNRAGGAENPATVSQQTTDFTPDPADGPPAAPAPPGAVRAPPAAFGRYHVRRALGAGGCGAVYLGDDPQLGRPVAIKVLRGGAGRAQAEGEPALQEARRLAQLLHPGIVAVHDVGVQEGQVYIVSDYLDGLNLGQRLREHRPAWPEAARIAAPLAHPLAHPHPPLIIHP